MTKKIEISSILNNSDSLVDLFNIRVNRNPNKKVFFKKQNGQWFPQSFSQTDINIKKIRNFFCKKNLRKGDRVFLLSTNRIEWVEFDIAIMSLGAVTVPSFVTNNLSDNKFIINDCKPKFIILENEKVFKKNKSILKNNNNKIILIESSEKFKNYESILKNFKTFDKKIKISSKDISSIIYTSGTTGNPKGVILSHQSIMHNLLGALDIMDEFLIDNERFISFLPLSHSYERMAGLYFPILIGAEIFFCTSMEKLLNEIKETRPTILSAVPRLYEGIFKKLKTQHKNSNSIISFFFKRVFIYASNKAKKLNLVDLLLAKIFIQLILKNKLRKSFGGKIKVFISGGAALNPEIGIFFNKVGLPLLQGYGQTEASPLISCNKKLLNNPKTVGTPVREVEVKISKKREILVRGKNLMLGYWKKSDLTKKTIVDGWLHTGDLGYLDNKGRIVIDGRKKDLIVTSGGDNISAQRIEYILMSYNEISQALIFGDNRPFLIALIELAQGYSINDIKNIINEVNTELNSIERIRKYLILDNELTYEKGFMTQTLKIKRKKVFDHYKKKIDKLYGIL